MCVIAIVYDPTSPTVKFLCIANRDEFVHRPTANASWWQDNTTTTNNNNNNSRTLGGKDLIGGGSWLLVQSNGRFATLTNYQQEEKTGHHHHHETSRGELVTRFVQSSSSSMDYLQSISAAADDDYYAGFNLMVYDGQTLGYLSNRNGGMRELPRGVYSVSNATLDTTGWYKTTYLKKQLEYMKQQQESSLLNDDEALFELLNHGKDFSQDLPLSESGPFVVRRQVQYGTRCSTIVREHANGSWEFTERRYCSDTFEPNGETRETFHVNQRRRDNSGETV